MTKDEIISIAKQMKAKSFQMLEEAPQSMSNVQPILNVIISLNELIQHLNSSEMGHL